MGKIAVLAQCEELRHGGRAMNSHDNAVTIDTPQLQTKRELLTAAIRRTDHDLGWMLNVVSPNFAPLEMVFLDETQVALIIDQDGDGKIEYDEYVQWFKHEKGKYNETEKAFDAAHDHMWSEVRTRAELQNPSGARPLNVTGLKAPEIY